MQVYRRRKNVIEEKIFTAAMPPYECQSNVTWEHHSLPNDSCNRYPSPLSNRTEPCKQGDWKYDLSTYTSTIISEWDLVCDREWMKELAQSIYMAGVLVGAILYGPLADRYGRRIILMCSLLNIALMGTGAALSPYFALYTFFRFMTGMGISGLVINSLGLTMEWTPKRHRPTVSVFQGICSTAGQVILAGVAYLVTNWRWLQLTLSVPFFIFFTLVCWVPESFRWLALANRSEQAIYNLNRAARINGEKDGSPITLEMLKLEGHEGSSAATSKMTPIDLFRTPAMRKITICLAMAWFSSSFSFFALAMDIQKFGFNIYLVQVVFGCIELPLRVVGTVIAAYIGRRIAVSFCLILSGVILLCSLAIPADLIWLQLAVTVLSKGFLGSSTICTYLFTAELFPTVVRQTGVGCTTMIMRLGAVFAPLVMMIKPYAPSLPLVVFGSVPIICGLPILTLPETLNCPLLDTIEEVEARGKGTTFNTKEKEFTYGTKL
ncbi:solute carrier family 22 member 6-B-like isoform X2 [Hyperolius riggenbachi]|uniref:solute carrier family 22 member 6-B-like isoform X2 n=1 Tax=Hyperolius riggenbachi TaxID=752182 RepID=UPI0035A3B740